RDPPFRHPFPPRRSSELLVRDDPELVLPTRPGAHQVRCPRRLSAVCPVHRSRQPASACPCASYRFQPRREVTLTPVDALPLQYCGGGGAEYVVRDDRVRA